MLILAGSIRLPPENLEAARPVMQRMIEASRAEEGCITYSFAEDLLEPGFIRIFEVFRDAEAQQFHAKSAHMAAWRAEWPALGIGERQITRYEVSSAVET
ncbi:MAG TPA: putative quinol monooxygenase [Sphingobium sp.]